MQTKLLGTSMGLNVTDQLLFRYFAFLRYWRKNRSTVEQYVAYLSS
jgi:hypothetical protein